MNALNFSQNLQVEAPGDEPIIVMTRTLDAPRALVWKVWTEPQHIVRWWGPRAYTTTIIKHDVRPGGEWRYEQRTPKGEVYIFNGKFLEVEAPGRLVNTFGVEGMFADTLVETHTFEEVDGKTHYTSMSRFDTIEERDGMVATGMEGGAKESMDKLEELLAELQKA